MPSLPNDWFLVSSDQHNYEISWSSLGNLHKPYKTNLYGKNFIIVSTINAWNNSQKLLKISLMDFSPNKIKKNLSDAFFAKYWFSNFASTIFVFPFPLCCCYFIIYIFLFGLPLIYWTKLLLLSTQALLPEIAPTQYKVWVVSFT